MANEMKDVAREVGCTHAVDFNQGKLMAQFPDAQLAVDDPGGICYGLAWVWMEYKARASHERFFHDLNAGLGKSGKPTLLKALALFKVVQAQANRTEKAAEQCRLLRANDANKQAKSKDLVVFLEDDMRTLANWLGAAMGERYFYIETSRHSMAASGSKLGNLQFFDPNFGVVETYSSATMAKFLTNFFKQDRIKNNYWRNNDQRELKILKLKKAA
jgi:YopT-type cysteine protease-like protein